MAIELGASGSTYTALFQDYLRCGLAQVLTRVRAADPLPSEQDRAQAWHLLTYAFQSTAAWPLTRDLLLTLAPKMEQAGFREAWLVYLDQGLVQAQQVADPATAAELHLQIGLLHRLQSNFALAHQHFHLSETLFAKRGDTQGEARALNQLAYLSWHQQHFEQAIHAAQRALHLLAKDSLEAGTSLSILGSVAIARNQWQEAEAYHRQALALRTYHGDKRTMAWSLQNLGFVLRLQQKHADAIGCYQQAIPILEQLADATNLAVAQMNLGIVYHDAGDSQKALELYSGSERIFVRVQERFNLAKLYTNMGLAYFTLQRWPAAEAAFRASIKLLQQLHDTGWRLNATDGLAMCYLAQNKAAQALAILEAAIVELPQIRHLANYPYLEQSLHDHLAEAKSQVGMASGAMPT